MKLIAAALPVLVLAACTAPTVDEKMEWRDSSLSSPSASPSAGIAATVFRTGGDGVRVRAGASTATERVGSLAEGAAVTIVCQTRGESVDGTDVWDRIESPSGYVLDAYLRTGYDDFVPGGPRCDDAADGTSSTPKPSAPPAGMSAIWGGRASSISFGFLAPNDLGYYSYSTEYGLDGRGHTGIDVGVPYNTPLYAPAAGTVRCAGTFDGPGADGAGCAAFNDYGDAAGGAVQGVGRIEIELDDGTVLILGHSRTSTKRPGERVAAGDRVGASGGMNGPHVHVEVRIRDTGTRSGWRIIDPRSRLD